LKKNKKRYIKYGFSSRFFRDTMVFPLFVFSLSSHSPERAGKGMWEKEKDMSV